MRVPSQKAVRTDGLENPLCAECNPRDSNGTNEANRHERNGIRCDEPRKSTYWVRRRALDRGYASRHGEVTLDFLKDFLVFVFRATRSYPYLGLNRITDPQLP